MRPRAACGIAYHGYIPTGREERGGKRKKKLKTPQKHFGAMVAGRMAKCRCP
jgi:hypothetical protein